MTNTEISQPFATLEYIEAIALVSNAEGQIVYVNQAVKKILGYNQKEVMGNGWWKLSSKEKGMNTRKVIAIAMALGNLDLKDCQLFEYSIRTKNGRTVWTQWTFSRTTNGLLLGLAQDITSKKKREQELLRKNEKNEFLLKEIHHRVKNNMQTIISLLSFKQKTITDKQALEALAESKNRINSMAIVHTKLYQSNNLASINFGDYINDLAEAIAKSYSTNENIQWTVKHSGVLFDLDLSTNLGLIITELMINAYKHAFNGMSKGNISVELKRLSKNRHQLIVEDNGNGIGVQTIPPDSESFGLKIVNALTEQINGTMETISNHGLKYLITFEN